MRALMIIATMVCVITTMVGADVRPASQQDYVEIGGHFLEYHRQGRMRSIAWTQGGETFYGVVRPIAVYDTTAQQYITTQDTVQVLPSEFAAYQSQANSEAAAANKRAENYQAAVDSLNQ